MTRASWMPADMLERVREQERDRQRRRRARKRERFDLARLLLDVPLFASADRLVEEGKLDEWDAENREAIAAALSAEIASRVTGSDDVDV